MQMSSANCITLLKQAKKNLDNVHVDLDDKYWLTLSKDQIIRFSLSKGKILSTEEKIILEKESLKRKQLEKVMRFISFRPRSKKEIEDYLNYRLELVKEDLEIVISELESRNLINDEYFSDWLAKSRLESGKYGIEKIRSELFAKGVSKETINKTIQVLQEENDYKDIEEESVNRYIGKYSRTSDLKDSKTREKIIRRLIGKGFRYDVIKKLLEEYK